MPRFRYISNVATLQLDQDRCGGCGVCTTVCPHAVFAIENRKATIADRDACMECGACSINCPDQAISVTSGVGCAAAIIIEALTGREPDCGCSDGPSCCG